MTSLRHHVAQELTDHYADTLDPAMLPIVEAALGYWANALDQVMPDLPALIVWHGLTVSLVGCRHQLPATIVAAGPDARWVDIHLGWAHLARQHATNWAAAT